MSFASIARRQVLRLGQRVARPNQVRNVATTTQHAWFLPSTPIESFKSIPTEAYPLIFFCIAMPSYGLYMGSKVFLSGKRIGEARAFTQSAVRPQAAVAPSVGGNVWRQRLASVPVEAYPLVFLCVAMPAYSVYCMGRAIIDGAEQKYLRLIPKRFAAVEQVEKNVWDQ
ncbi:hypothetical protein MNV49_006612 [Pseudohyphozyma bogoriensis]|nr:hypothetical protein MNV49_006612 [Pseudohyphozyma bogoriensis]